MGNLATPKSVQKRQTALQAKAKAEAGHRFYAPYDNISRYDRCPRRAWDDGRRPELVIVAVTIAVATPLAAREHRPRDVTRGFQREHPCPSTGRTTGACPGYLKDHVVPLVCGGPDVVSNLQWQTIRDARIKDG